jgi:DinB family protein
MSVTLQDALGRLEAAPETASSLARGLDARSRVSRPAPDSFSVLETVWHLRDIESEGFLVRIGSLLSEENPFLPDLDGAKLAAERRYNERDLNEGLEGFRSARLASVTALRLAGPRALDRAGVLEGVGPITLGGLVERMLEHDRDHLGDIRRIVEGARA